MLPLTDTQLVLLSAASQRDDGLLTPPARLLGGARHKVTAALLRLGLVAEVAVPRDAPTWRAEEDGRPLGLCITPAGLAALGLQPDVPLDEVSEAPAVVAAQGPVTASAARSGTKAALLLTLLGRPEGASLDDLTAATGWLPHTVRAALTRLRQAGHALARTKGDGGRSIYRIPGTGEG